MQNLKLILGGLTVVCVGAGAIWYNSTAVPTAREKPTLGDVMVAVQVPDLSGAAQVGKTIFDAACADCHGANAAGQAGVAPPLVHKIYEPSHHGDEAFQRAAALGVQAHHWPFGDMPPAPGVTRGDIAQVVAYIRALQRANGIK